MLGGGGCARLLAVVSVHPRVRPHLRAGRALAELRRESVTRALPLSRLTRTEIADFIRLTMGIEPGEALVTTIHSQTDDYPMFLSAQR
jgi:hypothetical protein